MNKNYFVSLLILSAFLGKSVCGEDTLPAFMSKPMKESSAVLGAYYGFRYGMPAPATASLILAVLMRKQPKCHYEYYLNLPGQILVSGAVSSTAAGSIAGVVGSQDSKDVASRASAAGVMAGLFGPFSFQIIRAMRNWPALNF